MRDYKQWCYSVVRLFVCLLPDLNFSSTVSSSDLNFSSKVSSLDLNFSSTVPSSDLNFSSTVSSSDLNFSSPCQTLFSPQLFVLFVWLLFPQHFHFCLHSSRSTLPHQSLPHTSNIVADIYIINRPCVARAVL